MSLASDIITDARRTLADTARDRWTDEDLLSFLNSGIAQMAIDTELIKSNGFVLLVDGVQKYDLSAIASKITRVEFAGIPVPFQNHLEMDKVDPGWNEFTQGTTPTAIVYDKLNMSQFKVYPIPGAAIEYAKSNSPYGLLTAVYDAGTIVPDVEAIGLNTGAVLTDYVNVFYVVKPDKLLLTDESPFDRIWDQALEHYIVGRALRMNMDTQSRQFAQEELGAYAALVGKADNLENKSFTKKSTRTVPYNNGV